MANNEMGATWDRNTEKKAELRTKGHVILEVLNKGSQCVAPNEGRWERKRQHSLWRQDLLRAPADIWQPTDTGWMQRCAGQCQSQSHYRWHLRLREEEENKKGDIHWFLKKPAYFFLNFFSLESNTDVSFFSLEKKQNKTEFQSHVETLQVSRRTTPCWSRLLTSFWSKFARQIRECWKVQERLARPLWLIFYIMSGPGHRRAW